MSLIARCPACATLFRVVPDQLKISDGWVRCGQCSEVFDANLTLQEAPAPTAADSAPAEAQPQPDRQPLPERPAETPLDTASDVTPDVEPALAQAQADPVEPDPEPEPAPETDPEPEPRSADEPAQAVAEPAEPVLEPGPLPGDSVEASAEPEAAAQTPPADEPVTADGPAPELQDLAFVRQARRRAFWGRRGVRVTMGVTAGVLALLLTGQVVFHHRDRLASQVPALQPALAAICASFQCRLGPPRRIESIAIESSAFTRVRADAFRLSLTLSNQADIALAMPAMELTLTDLQDQPVLRRVLQPAELGPETPSAIAARAEWSTTLTLAIAPGANPARIVGYRVLAFYP